MNLDFLKSEDFWFGLYCGCMGMLILICLFVWVADIG